MDAQSNNANPWGTTSNSQGTFNAFNANTNTDSTNTNSSTPDLASYLLKIPALISAQNGKALAQHLSFRQCPKSQLFHQISKTQLRGACSSRFTTIGPWGPILSEYLQSALHS